MTTADSASSESPPCSLRRLTGDRSAAIAVFELQGHQALEVAAGHLQLRNNRSPLEQPLQKIAFGYWKHRHDSKIDDEFVGSLSVPSATEDVVFCRTSHDRAELHVHGSGAVAESIFRAFADRGVPVLGSEVDPTINLNMVDLPLPELLRHLEPQWWGNFPGEVPRTRWEALVEHLTAAGLPAAEQTLIRMQSLALVHLGRAQASEVGHWLWAQLRGACLLRLEAIARKMLSQRAAAIADLDALLATWSYGKYLSREIQVLVVGAPNVGKSSLINALLGYQRSVVSDTPGTTRDLVGQATSIAGWQFRLVDSAGLRHSADMLETQGIRRATQAAATADLIILVQSVDQSAATIEVSAPQTPILSVLNKVDLWAEQGGNVMAETIDGRAAISTKTGHGLPELMSRIVKKVLPAPTLPRLGDSDGSAVVFAPEVLRYLQIWRQDLSPPE